MRSLHDWIAQVIVVGCVICLAVSCGSCRVAHAAEGDNVAIQTIILEAGGESFEGMVAVGEVIRNRAKIGHKSVYKVCTTPKAFSCWNNDVIANKRLSMVSGQVFQRASHAWAESEATNLTMGATHYLAKGSLKHLPKWVNGAEQTVVIMNHTFYRGVK